MKRTLDPVILREAVQAVLAVAVTVGLFALVFMGRVPPSELWAGWGLIIGFFFGGMVRRNGEEAAARRFEAAIAGREHPQAPPSPRR